MITPIFRRFPSCFRVLAVATVALCSAAVAGSRAVPAVRLVKEINPGTEGSDPAAFVTLDGAAYFRANDGSHGFELWRTDGSEAGTELVIDLNPGLPNGFPDSMAALNGSLY